MLMQWRSVADIAGWFYDAIHFKQQGHDRIYNCMVRRSSGCSKKQQAPGDVCPWCLLFFMHRSAPIQTCGRQQVSETLPRLRDAPVDRLRFRRTVDPFHEDAAL
ncbi:MAG: hypothetical protein K0Q94_2844 [Paenibacillus sp.]|nr:hypothetical protein [Paenibacillus sp.]